MFLVLLIVLSIIVFVGTAIALSALMSVFTIDVSPLDFGNEEDV
jgi:hypothetical protein